MNARRLAAVLVFGLLGCASDEVTGLDITLVTNPDRNTFRQISDHVTTVRFVFDSPDGLYPTGATARRDGELVLQDVDEDNHVELFTDLPLGDRLPTVRLERGGLSDVPVDVLVEGIGEQGQVVASGEARGMRFEAGKIKDEEPAPFNLLQRFLPPRVVAIYLASKDYVLIVFSKHMNAASLKRRLPTPTIQLSLVDTETPVDPLEIAVEGNVQAVPTARFYVEQPFVAGAKYRLEISTEAMDLADNRLVQEPRKYVPNGYTGTFKVSEAGAEFTTMASDPYCPGGTPCPEPPACNDRTCAMDFQCIDDVCLPQQCPECSAGTVCDPNTRVCVFDCRPYGRHGCNEPATCGEDGLCR